MSTDFAPQRTARPVAVVVLWVEASIALAAAGAGLLLAVIGDSDGQADVAAQAVLAAVVALGLGTLAVGLTRARRWALAPALTWQLLQGFAGAYFLVNGQLLYGAIAVALALAGGLALVPLLRESPR